MIYDVIVVGAGHAGCESALAAARMGCSMLLLTMNLDTVAKMSCNPAIGGIGKGHMAREIDALGGDMGKVTDRAGIQFRMLNSKKGPAVWAPRAQCDRVIYQFEMKRRIEETPGLHLRQGTTESLLVEDGEIRGVTTLEGETFLGKTVVLSAGTFMRGLMHMGENQREGGRAGDRPAVGISASLLGLGFELDRQKTGTPPRLSRRSLDLTQCELQPGEEGIRFSYDDEEFERLPQLPCWITYTTAETKRIVEENIHRSPLFSGQIQGIGARYCPSFEDKVHRFAEKERHQIFLEPEGLNTQEIYCNGISTSLPIDVQERMIRSIPGLEKAEIMRPAYAVEYDFVKSGQMGPTLETHRVSGLFLAGQVNGTSGYEEAAGQGLVAGINAACKTQNREPLILKRSESYIGVMIDDLVTTGIDEPYRMFTSRAEYRLLLRQDNADLRLRHHGHRLGLISDAQMERTNTKRETVDRECKRLAKIFKEGNSLAQLLCRPENDYNTLLAYDEVTDHGTDTNAQIELTLKYAGYIERQTAEVARLQEIESVPIPDGFDYAGVKALRHEAQEKMSGLRPANLGQASRIPGISPADISVLMITLGRR
jgi:tRNA uridine 5-carboxymethylaminomethyl modification enzyme